MNKNTMFSLLPTLDEHLKVKCTQNVQGITLKARVQSKGNISRLLTSLLSAVTDLIWLQTTSTLSSHMKL